jgi:hypothetical protein
MSTPESPVSTRAPLCALLALAALGAGCEPPPDNQVEALATPLHDGLPVVGESHQGSFGVDGNGRMLAVWLTVDSSSSFQLIGQIFSTTTGLPLSSAQVYTSGGHPRKGSAHVAYGGGKYMVAYEEVFSPTDNDLRGIVVGAGGSSERIFTIDSSAFNDTLGDLVYVPDTNQFFGLWTRDQSPSQRERVYYLDTSGNLVNQGELLGSPASTARAAYGDGRIAVAWTGGGLNRTSLMPGQIAATSTTVVTSDSKIFSPAIAFNPTQRQFGLTVFRSDTTDDKIFAQTFAAGCSANSCASPFREIGSKVGLNLTVLGLPTIAAAAEFFVVGATMMKPTQQGTVTFSLDSTAFARITHNPALSPPCGGGTTLSGTAYAGPSLGATALFSWFVACQGAAAVQAVRFDKWGNRDFVFPITD